jgi:hypothetical protein
MADDLLPALLLFLQPEEQIAFGRRIGQQLLTMAPR